MASRLRSETRQPARTALRGSSPRAAGAALAPPAYGIGFVDSAQRVVQRDIGFEYETNADTYEAGAALTNAQRQAAGMPVPVPPVAAPAALNKGDVLVANMGGLHAKADEGGILGSNLELETDPFPETAAGRRGLHRALKNLERFCALINAKRGATPHFRDAHLAAAFGGALPAVPGAGRRYIRALGNVTGNPQTTAGVRLDKVEELMERTLGGPTGGPHAVGGGLPPPPVSRIELGMLSPPDFQRVGNAPRHARAGIANYWGAYAGVNPLPGAAASDALVGLCGLLLSYIMRGTVGMPYAKQIAPVMARTEFGTIFTNLPPAEQAFFSAGGGVEFRAMFTAILAQAGVGGGLAAQLFQFEPAVPAAAVPPVNISGSLSRSQWLSGISQNNDLLTSLTFPSAPARPHMFGLGGFGALQGPDPTGGGVLRPILEFRRMAAGVAPHTFTEVAMGVYDYIVALNAAGAGVHPAYNRVARRAKSPTLGQKLSYWWASR
jgi:hypothetical protein